MNDIYLDEEWEQAINNDCVLLDAPRIPRRFSSKNYEPSKETEKRIRYMAWCFDMHNLLTRLLNWIWKRIE